jgi:hypothetical protein
MSAARLLKNQITASVAIDYALAFVLGVLTMKWWIGLIVMAYGIWCYRDGRVRLLLQQAARHENHT